MTKKKTTSKPRTPKAPAPWACVPKELPPELHLEAARAAVLENPANAARSYALAAATGLVLPPQHLALLTSKYWGKGGVDLTVSFLEPAPADLRDRILSHMNAWGEHCNARFRWVQSGGKVRITRSGQGYWSYVGTDVLHIAAGEPTMCLQAFTMQTPESEYRRVVRHETGHTLGFPHEQQLPEVVELLDPTKTITWGRQALGWDEATVRSQILTPIDPRAVTMTPHADVRGIMCYSLPASITRNGQPIPGGTDIDSSDAYFAGTVYPKAPPLPPPPPPGGRRSRITLTFDGDVSDYTCTTERGIQ